MRADDERHGSYAGAQVHRKQGEVPCEPCREAAAAYMRERRKVTPPHRAARERERSAARSRALWRLADRYPDEFQALYLEELPPAPLVTVAGATS